MIKGLKFKSWRKITKYFEARLAKIQKNSVEVSAVLRIGSKDAILFSKLGFRSNPDGSIAVPPSFMPPEANGHGSKENKKGKIVVRRDLPKISKAYTFEVPTWGSLVNTHTVTQLRQVYVRDNLPPYNLPIEFQILDVESCDEPQFIIKATVPKKILKSDKNFEKDLVFCLSLLQENVGMADIYAANTTNEEYLQTLYVDWEFLPPGNRSTNLAKIISGYGQIDDDKESILTQRYKLLEELKPKSFIRGINGFKRYFGAQFADDLVVFENIEYGNAIYIMFESWKSLSKQSRLVLLKNSSGNFVRIPHIQGWEDELKKIVREKLEEMDI